MKHFGVPATVFVCPGLAGLSNPFWPERVAKVWSAARQSPKIRKVLSNVCIKIGIQRFCDPLGTAGADLGMLIDRIKQLTLTELEQVLDDIRELEPECDSLLSSTRMDGTMTWEDAARISQQGIQIGSHTQTHRILTRLPSAQAQKELHDSKASIEKELDHDCTLFAYPNGSWSTDIRDLVIQEGYTQAFSNKTGVWTSTTDPWLIPRVNLWEASVTGPSGRFSPVVFEYATFWRGYWAEFRKRDRVTNIKDRG